MPTLRERKNSFRRRVNYAHAAFLRREDSRAFDDCFEMYDGEFVVTALMRRAASDPQLKAEILRDMSVASGGVWENVPWQNAAAKYRHVSDASLADLAAQRQIEAEWVSVHIHLPQLAASHDPDHKPFEIVRREGPSIIKECFYARNLREATNAVKSWTNRTVLGVPFLSMLASVEIRSPDGDIYTM